MFTMENVYDAMDNPVYFTRGKNYEREGRVERLDLETPEGRLEGRGVVRGYGEYYDVEFTYNLSAEKMMSCSCSCPLYARTQEPCKHVAALMIHACHRLRNRGPSLEAAAKAKKQSAQQIWERLMREQKERIRREEERRAAQERARTDSYIARLIEEGEAGRIRRMETLAGEEKKKVRLDPIFSMENDYVGLEMKIGRTRTYVVRNLWEFASRVRMRERTVYGKELTFSHTESELEERDAALMRHIVLLAQTVSPQQKAQMRLTGAMLDQTMRLLMGRDVLVRRGDGTLANARVTQGDAALTVRLKKTQEGTSLRVDLGKMLAGDTGAYWFAGEEILCLYGEAFERIAGLVRVAKDYPKGLCLREEQLDAICAQVLAPARACLTVAQGQKLLLEHMPAPMTAHYYLDAEDAAEGGGRLLCRVSYEYGGRHVAPEETAEGIRRDALLERRALEAVKRLFPERIRPDEYAFSGTDEAMFDRLASAPEQLRSLGEVYVSQRLAGLNVRTRRTLSFGVTQSGTQLLACADMGGYTQEDLEAAYAAYRQKRRYVRLRSGAFLSGEALEQVAQAAQIVQGLGVTAEALGKGTDIPAARVLYMEDAIQEREGMSLTTSDAVAAWLRRLREARGVQAQAPSSLRAELRPYQRTGLSWLCALSHAGFGGILADDMGLGKTVQALALLLHEKEEGHAVRALVVCPASLQLNWKAEALRFAPSLSCSVLMGPAQGREREIREGQAELMITSYDQLKRDICAYEGRAFTHVLLDEAQTIKNAASHGAKAVKTLRAAHRFAMTGTPIENRLSELWSIFDFLMPGYLYGYKRFRERFEAPIVREGDEQARRNLHGMVAPFILRRMKKDVLDELPEKVDMTLTSEMTPEQGRLYRAYLMRMQKETEGRSLDAQGRMQLLAGLTRLRQLCCDPRLCLEGYAGGSGKLVQAVDMVRTMTQEGHRILLFSQFTSMLALLEEALAKEGIRTLKLTGETPKLARMRLVDAFNAGEAPVFLISLKAGGTGLNLTGADVVIHYDPWWNTAAQNQATDRAYRIGQTRGVQVISLIASGTIEERILLLQREKQALSDGVLSGPETLFTLSDQMLRQILHA